MQVIVDSLLINYSRSGQGRILLIIPGWADNSKSWRQFQSIISSFYDVIVIDLPGFGGSQKPSQAWGLTEYANFLGRFLKKIGVKPYAILGHSNGGAIALRGLSTGQISAERLVLLASAGIRNQYKGRKKMLRLLTKSGKILTLPLPARMKINLRRKVYTTIGSDMLVAEHLQATFKKIIEDDVQSDAAKINCPTLILYGQNDQQTPILYGQQFHQLISQSTLEILPDAGHFAHLDRSDEVIRSIKKFLL